MSHPHMRRLPPQMRERLLQRDHHLRRELMHHDEPRIQKLTDRGQPQDPVGGEIFDDLFFIIFPIGNLAAGATYNNSQLVPQDSRFEWMRSTWYGNLHGATPPFNDSIQLNVNIFITDTGSGRQLMTAPVPIPMLSGLGKLPFINPTSRIFNATSTIQINGTNFDAVSQFDNIYFLMLGRKLYRTSIDTRQGM